MIHRIKQEGLARCHGEHGLEPNNQSLHLKFVKSAFWNKAQVTVPSLLEAFPF